MDELERAKREMTTAYTMYAVVKEEATRLEKIWWEKKKAFDALDRAAAERDGRKRVIPERVRGMKVTPLAEGELTADAILRVAASLGIQLKEG